MAIERDVVVGCPACGGAASGADKFQGNAHGLGASDLWTLRPVSFVTKESTAGLGVALTFHGARHDDRGALWVLVQVSARDTRCELTTWFWLPSCHRCDEGKEDQGGPGCHDCWTDKWQADKASLPDRKSVV